MQLKVNGKPYIYQHKCAPEDSDRILTDTEIHEFLVSCLIESFEKRGTRCIRHTPDFNSGADFSYIKVGRTVRGVVYYIPERDNKKISDLFGDLFSSRFYDLYPQLAEGYEKHGSIPIFFMTEMECLDNRTNEPIAGGRYKIKFTPIQVLENRIPTKGENISEYSMYKGYASSWQTGDTSFMKDYVSSYFHGYSDFSFDEITSKEELLTRVSCKHEQITTTHQSITAFLIKDKDNGEKGILIRLGENDTCFVTLSFSNYRISRSHTKSVPSNYEHWNKAYELYETHGDHHAPFINDEELRGFLNIMIKDSSLCLKLDTEVKFDDNEPLKTKVASLKYICDEDIDDIAYLALIAYNPLNNSNVFISCYPYLKGIPVKVEVLDVLEWDNRLEATIKCRYSDNDEEFDFHFFATDYYFNKDQYKIGRELEISIAATSGNVKEASKGFSFEGKQAIDFLAKIGEKPTYKENGEVESVKFSTENLVAFLPNDEKCPDMAEFQSPTRDLMYDSFYNNSVNRCVIKIHNDPNLEVPLYFNDEFTPKNGAPIMGWLWLSGRLSNPCEFSPSPMKLIEILDMEKTSSKFIKAISKIIYRSLVDVTPLLGILENLSIPEGKHLFAVRVGNADLFYYELFAADFSLLTTVNGLINRDGFIPQELEYKFKSLTQELNTVLNGYGVNSVWQSFLLSMAGRYMPFNKAYSSKSHYILTEEDAQKSSKALNGRLDYFSLLPVFSKDKDGSGYFAVMLWDKGELYRQIYTYTVRKNNISFQFDESYKVFDSFNTERYDSHILFRE